jgi:DNA-binding MarR family transcriptional regulator
MSKKFPKRSEMAACASAAHSQRRKETSKGSEKRSELLMALGREFRHLATATILFHQAIADRLGMHATDHKCAELLLRTGPLTAGELAQRTGLTTGAITGVIDRLEMAGFVRRAEDPRDRRRVVIEPFPQRIDSEIGPLFKSLVPAMDNLCAGYSSRELTIIREFVAGVHQVFYDQIQKLREEGGNARPGKRSRATPSA